MNKQYAAVRAAAINSLKTASLAWAACSAPFWYMAIVNGVTRPIFNLDYLIPIALAPISGYLYILTLAVAILADVCVASSVQYYFVSPVDLIYSSRYMTNLNLARYFSTNSYISLLLVAVFALAAWRILKAKSLRFQHGLLSVFVLSAFAISADIANGSPDELRVRGGMIFPLNISGSPIHTILWGMKGSGYGNPTSINDEDLDKQRKIVEGWAKANPKRGVILIIVESWGISTDERIQRYLVDTLGNGISDRYESLKFHTPFKGATTYAELRELCGVTASYRKLGHLNATVCLPNVMRGRRSIAIHGFVGSMFARNVWWKSLGFSETMFRDDFRELDVRFQKSCGTVFPGICDKSLIDYAFLRAKEGKFVYALTLNSHLPLQASSSNEANYPIKIVDSEQAELISAISKSLAAVNRNMRTGPLNSLPLVVVVGDHSPPFWNVDIRKSYSQDYVPKYIFIPRV